MDKNKFKKQAEGIWGEVKKVAGKTVDGLEKVTKISQIKIDQTRQKYDRSGLLKELGAAVYQMSKAGKKEFDSSVTDIIEQIDQIDKKIESETQEIQSIKAVKEVKVAAAPKEKKKAKKPKTEKKEEKAE